MTALELDVRSPSALLLPTTSFDEANLPIRFVVLMGSVIVYEADVPESAFENALLAVLLTADDVALISTAIATAPYRGAQVSWAVRDADGVTLDTGPVHAMVHSSGTELRMLPGRPALSGAHTGVTDHGLLTGLADDDHPLYALADGSRGAFAAPSHAHVIEDIPEGVLTQAEGDARYVQPSALSAHTAAEDPHPIYLTSDEADAFYASAEGLSLVATSGAYADLTGLPTIPTVPGDVGAEPAGAVEAHEAAGDPHPQYLQGGSFATVATTGEYSDLLNTPAAGEAAGAVAAHEAAGDPHAQYQTQSDGDARYVQPGALAAVATSGEYVDLTGLPTIPTTPGEVGAEAAGAVAAHEVAGDPHAQYQTETEADARYVQPGSLAPVAVTGAYTDLSGRPTIPTTPGEVGAEPAGAVAAHAAAGDPHTLYVPKGTLIYNAADYASLSAAISAVPAGATLYLPTGGTYAAAGLTAITKNLTLVGDGPLSSIIACSGAYGFNLAGAAGPARLVFRNLGFTGSTSAQIRLTGNAQTQAEFHGCRFSGHSQYAIETYGTEIWIDRCEFDGAGTGVGTAIYADGGADLIRLKDSAFSYLFRGLYCVNTNGPSKNVRIDGCTFDGGWMYLKSNKSSSGGTVTYTATTLTDSAGGFAPAVGSTVRAMAVKQTGTFTTVGGTTALTDSAASFVSNGVKRGDIIRTSARWAVVDEVVSATVLRVEDWLDLTTYAPAPTPSVSTAYTIYGLVLGKVSSSTSTVVTVDAWRDWDGTLVTPANGTMYELAIKTDYQVYINRADHVAVSGNTVRRSWADSIAPLNARNLIVSDNVIYDGQDVGITFQGSGAAAQTALIIGNRISHMGTAGVHCSAASSPLILGNSIEEHSWMSLSTTTYAGVVLDSVTDAVLVDNVFKRVNHPNALRAVHILGTSSNIELTDNKYIGYASVDILLTGTGVTGVSGTFAPGTRISLASSAVGPRGRFSGTGSPEGVVSASPGAVYYRTDGGVGTVLYVKETGTASTGWRPFTNLIETKADATRSISDPTNQRVGRWNVVDDSSSTSSWPDRLAFQYNGVNTGYFNEYGELRSVSAKNSTTAIRAMGYAGGAHSGNIFDVQTERNGSTVFNVTRTAVASNVNMSAPNLTGAIALPAAASLPAGLPDGTIVVRY